MTQKYKITFECYVTVEAKDKDEATQKAWLQENINKGSYTLMSVIKEAK